MKDISSATVSPGLGSFTREQVSPIAATNNKFMLAHYLRGIAALWVMLFHLAEGKHIDHLKASLPHLLGQIVFDHGNLGVAIFFALSGFVIAHSSIRHGTADFVCGRFVLRRLVRLCPPYYFSIVVVIAFMLLKAAATRQAIALPSGGDVMMHLLFLQEIVKVPPINVVYWTLCIELQFYLVFALMMLLVARLQRTRLKTYAWPMLFGIAALAGLLAPLGIVQGLEWNTWFLPTWHLFIAGVLLHQALLRGGRYVLAFAVYAAILLLACYRGTGGSGTAFTLMGAATAIFLFYGERFMAARARRDRGESGSAGRAIMLLAIFGQLLGTISYSLYLLHNPITGASAYITSKVLGHSVAAEIVAMIFASTACIVGAWIAYRLIERPSLQWARRF